MILTEYQNIAINKLEKFKVGALFMEMGTGKTYTAYNLIKQVDYEYLLWICPFRLKEQTNNELESYGGLSNIEIIGVETLSSSDRVYLDVTDKVNRLNTFIVIDESIKIKNVNAKRTKRIIQLSKFAKYKLILNGTPITKNVMDLWAQFEFLSPKILKMNYNQFKNTFVEWVKITSAKNGQIRVKEIPKAYHNLEYLYSLISNYVYQCKLDISNKQLHYEFKYELYDEELDTYNEIKNDYLSRDKLEQLNNNFFMEMTQKLHHSYCLSKDKLEVLNDILKDYEPEQVLIYCKFIKSYEYLKALYPNINILTYGKHSYGLNLQNYNVTIYFDKTFDYGQMLQSAYRIYRMGQEKDCIYINLTGNCGLENMINKNIERKTNLLNYIKEIGEEEFRRRI